MRAIRMVLAAFALAAATTAVVATPAQAGGWQAWGAWTDAFGANGVTFQCQNYVDATTVGSQILISASLNCGHSTSSSLYLSASPGGGTESKWCYQASSCYISKYVSNPGGSQSWRVLATS